MARTTDPTFQRCFIYYRKLRGFTQESLAEEIDVSLRYVQYIEQDGLVPAFEIMKRIIVALDIPPGQIFGIEPLPE